MTETKKLDGFLEDIQTLKRHSKLLKELLGYYNEESMDFIIPDKWSGRIRADKYPAETPKLFVHKMILDSLTGEELCNCGIYNHTK